MLVRLAYRLLAKAQHTAYRVDRALREVIVSLHDPRLERYAIDLHYDASPTYPQNATAGRHPFE